MAYRNGYTGDDRDLDREDRISDECDGKFPANSIQEPTAFMSQDPMEMYNNILVFIVTNSTSHTRNAHISVSKHIGARLSRRPDAIKNGQGSYSQPKKQYTTPISQTTTEYCEPYTRTPYKVSLNYLGVTTYFANRFLTVQGTHQAHS
nr:unnamed protein product [Callosobruchus analis]